MLDRKHSYRIPFARYPAVRLAVLFAAGIGMVRIMTDSPLLLWAGVLAGFVIYRGIEYRHRKRLAPGWHKASLMCYVIIVILFGGLWYQAEIRPSKRDLHLKRMVRANSWDTLQFHGQVVDVSKDSVRMRIVVAVDSTVMNDSLTDRSSYRASSYLSVENRRGLPSIELGDYIVYRGMVYLPEGLRNPHEFDYPAYLKRVEIAATTGVEEIRLLRRSQNRWSWIGLRRGVHRLIEQGFSRPVAPLAKAILIGEKSELSDHTRQSFARSGLAHVMAVSGMHVGFIVAPLWLLIPWFWRYRWGKAAGLSILVAVLGIYAGITGFSASVVRASLTALLLAYGKLYHRRRDSINLTAVAALILLVADPRYLFDVGFQLSFTAVFSILIAWPLIDRRFNTKSRFRRTLQLPAKLFLLSLLVQTGLLPLLAYHFGEVSLVSPLVNMVVMVGVGLLVQWGLVGLLVTAGAPGWGKMLLQPVDLVLQWLQTSVEAVADWSLSWIALDAAYPVWWGVLWACGLLAIAACRMPRHRWKLLIACLMIFSFWQTEALWDRWRFGKRLTVTALDVGQSDALVIRTPNEKNMLIDAGRWSPDFNSGEATILPYLKAESIDTLHAVVLSHPHADHIGGMETILQNIPVRRIYHPGVKHPSALFERIKNIANQKNVPLIGIRAGDRLSIDPSVRCYVLGPPITSPDQSGVNNRSVILQLVYGRQRLLFTGDAGRQQEQRLVAGYGERQPGLLRADYLKAGHHGSNTSSSNALLKHVRPNVSVVSVGWRNRYGHPHPAAVRRLRRWTTDTVRFTGIDRAVIYESDGRHLRHINWDNRQF